MIRWSIATNRAKLNPKQKNRVSSNLVQILVRIELFIVGDMEQKNIIIGLFLAIRRVIIPESTREKTAK